MANPQPRRGGGKAAPLPFSGSAGGLGDGRRSAARLLIVKLERLVLAGVVCAGLFAGHALRAAAQKSTKTAPAKTSTKTSAKSGKSKSKSSKSARNRSRKPSSQQQPDEARIREIQQALATRGYNVEVSGAWGPQSVEALKKFQEDQNINNLTGRGKLDSLTLIALGLGPTRPPAGTAAPAAEPARESKQP